MLSKNAEKYINSLRIKKQRYVEKKYIAEGPKVASDYLSENVSISEVYATESWIRHHEAELTKKPEIAVCVCEAFELKKISTLTTPCDVLLVCNIPSIEVLTPANHQVFLALDNIQDPGNMGTIIRTADWMGINSIICNDGCVDIYNPKVVQAAMGSLPRVTICETNLPSYFNTNKPIVYAGMLEGENIFNISFEKPSILLIGNEGNGVQPELLPYITHSINIPSKGNAESLNAAIAAGILMAFASLK